MLELITLPYDYEWTTSWTATSFACPPYSTGNTSSPTSFTNWLFSSSLLTIIICIYNQWVNPLEKATLEKIIIVSNEEEKSQFVKDVGEDVLPVEYGGHAKLV
nr:hypothetical protein [Tanacetum cinerariifolium]